MLNTPEAITENCIDQKIRTNNDSIADEIKRRIKYGGCAFGKVSYIVKSDIFN